MDTDSATLALIIDTDPNYWVNENVDSFLDSIRVFVNVFLLMRQQNSISVFAARTGSSSVRIYPISEYTEDVEGDTAMEVPRDASLVPLLYNETTTLIIDRVRAAVTVLPLESHRRGISCAYSMALCYLNRIRKDNPGVRQRMMCIQVGTDATSEYVAVMNAIFSAQRQKIPIDAIFLGNGDSMLLKQACDLTGGIYKSTSVTEELRTVLLMKYISGTVNNTVVHAESVDYRAVCVCHRRPVEYGNVCSICLAVYCELRPNCTICGTKFTIETIVKKKKKPGLGVAPKLPK